MMKQIPKTLFGNNTIYVHSNINELKQIILEAELKAMQNTNMVVQSVKNSNDMNGAKLT